MTGWRQAVFVRQRRIDVIQRALSKVLDEESWSPATPRRLHVGSADASSRGWTMIIPELANFFLDHGGTPAPRLSRLARELHCPAYEVDVRRATATTLIEVDAFGRMRISGSRLMFLAGPSGAGPGGRRDGAGAGEALAGLEVSSEVVGFGLLSFADDHHDQIAALDRAQPMALADYLGALAGFPGWTRHGEDGMVGAAGELVYEPPRTLTGTHARVTRPPTGELTAPPPETREASARSTPRAVPPSYDRRGRRPRSAARPRR
ncbi:MAG TPA: hypothetical protein VFT22_21930 [Kofleriaceae bacterium]|nr:hypothetical protein [Kofleriaceae bacterium]